MGAQSSKAESYIANQTASVQLNNTQKWWISIAVALLAGLIFSPFTYGVTNSLFGKSINGTATFGGLFLHIIVFALLLRLIMW